jgi:5-methylcytosine-specific restriction protein A
MKTEAERTFYGSYPWKQIRLVVLKRDNHTCQICGTPGANTVDHIVPLRQDWARRLDPTNLRAACARCQTTRANRNRGPRTPPGWFRTSQPW